MFSREPLSAWRGWSLSGTVSGASGRWLPDRPVREGHYCTAAVGEIDRGGRVCDRNERAVLADEAVVVDSDGLARNARTQERALRRWEGRPVRPEVMDRGVTGPAEQLRVLLVAENPERRRVQIANVPSRIDDVERVGDGRDRREQRFRVGDLREVLPHRELGVVARDAGR